MTPDILRWPRVAWGVAGVLLLAGCGRAPERYPVPAQRAAVAETGAAVIPEQFAAMGSPWAEEHIVKDIVRGPVSGGYRWTGGNPALRFRTGSGGPWRLVVNFAVAEATLRTTGPVRVEFAVNGTGVGAVACARDGYYRFEKEVEAGPGEVIVSAAVDRTWVSPEDGARLGFMLMDAGLVAR